MNPMLSPGRFHCVASARRALRLAAAGLAALVLAPFPADAADAKEKLAELRARLVEQVRNYPGMQVLRSTFAPPKNQIGQRDSHELVVRIFSGIHVVSEEHDVQGVVLGKDYFLDKNELYALRIWHREPTPDGQNARITESRFFFDQGAPIYRGNVAVRVPASVREPDLTKGKETEVPLPPGLEGWGAKLKARAFTIARSFRGNVGQYAFGQWDEFLPKDAPPDDGSLTDPKPAREGLPGKDTRVLPIPDTESPDGIFQIGWGYDQAPVDWPRLADPQNGEVLSTKFIKDDLQPPLSEDSNYLVNAITKEPLSNIGLYHPGERQRFNHDEILVHWSPGLRCVVVKETMKWGTEQCGIGWIKDGKCAGTFDILLPLSAAAEEAVKKSSHPAGKRLRKGGDDWEFGVGKVLVEDDGRFETEAYAQIRRDEEPSGSYSVAVTGIFLPGKKGEMSAVLQNAKVKVLPPSSE